MLCKKSLSNPVRFGRKQRQTDDFCAVDYLGSSEGSFFLQEQIIRICPLREAEAKPAGYD